MKSIRNSTLNLMVFTLFAFSIPILIAFIADIHHPDWQTPRYSWQYPIITVLLIASIIILWRLWILLRHGKVFSPRTQGQTIGFIVAVTVFTAGIWLLLPTPFHLMAMFIRLYFVSLIAVISLVTFSHTGELSLKYRPLWIFVIVAGVALVLTVLLLGRVPEVLTYDEQGEMNLSYYIATTHNLYWPMYPSVTPAILGFATTLPELGAGLWMQIFGFSFTQIRFYYLVAAWLCVPFIFIAVKKLYGQSAAWVAALLVLPLALIHNIVRPELFVILAFCIGLACFLKARETSSTFWHYLTGLILTAGIEAHPYAARYLGAVGLIYLFDYVRILRNTGLRGTKSDHRVFWSFSAGVATFAVFYIILHTVLLPASQGDPNFVASLTSIYSVQSAAAKTGAVTSSFPQHVLSENFVLYTLAFYNYPMEFLLLIVVVIAAIIRRSPSDKLLLWLFFSSSIFGSLILAHAGTHYWSFNIPFLVAFTGAAIGSIPQQKVFSASGLCAICLLITVFTADILERAGRPHPSDSYLAIGSKINSLVPKDAIVVGYPLYYLSMLDRKNYVASENYYGEKNFFRGKELGKLPAPDAFIYTSGVGFVNDSFNFLALPTIHNAGLQAAYCFKTQYGNDIILYLPPAQVPENADLTGCDVPSFPG